MLSVKIARIYLAATLIAAAGAMLVMPLTSAAQAPSANASGEVRRIDAASGKITLKHGAIPALGLSAMSLVYRINPALLANVKPGQQVKFTATRQGQEYVITAIE